jgi:hypothetical protein
MIRITCKCGRVMELGDEHAGKRGACATCGRVLVAPPVAGAVQAAKPPARKAAAQGKGEGNPPPENPPASRTVMVCAAVCLVIGLGAYQAVAPQWFPPPPGGGFNFTRILVAGLVGGACAGLGAGLGKLLDAVRGS